MTPSVIVIDDDEDTVRLFSEFLEENEIHVTGKGYDGKTAVELYKEKKPDCVLIDIMMPNGSGFYAIKKIKEINHSTRTSLLRRMGGRPECHWINCNHKRHNVL